MIDILKKMFTTLALTLVSLHFTSGVHNTAYKAYDFPYKKLVLAEPSFDNETLFYAMCDQSPKQCTVVREINPFTMATETKKCDVNLNANDVQLVVGFGKDKAILVTQELRPESPMLKTVTVNMANCKTVDAELLEIPSNWRGIQMYRKNLDVVVFKNGFEVIIKGLSQICSKPNERKYCSFGFDAEGKRIEGPLVWPKIAYDDINIVSSVLTDASGKGYFFVNQNITLIGLQVDRIGGPTHIKLWGPTQMSADLSRGGFSVANKANGACYSVDSLIKCWQNDAEGGLNLQTEFTFEHQHEIWNLYVHNLRDGGFVVLAITCPDGVCLGVEDHYYLMKTDSKGKLIGYVDIDVKSKCHAENGNILAKVFENNDGQYCAVRLCKNRLHEEGKLEVLSDCYSDDDFSN